MSGKKYNKDKLFAKITHTASSGVVGQDEYEVYGEINLKVVTTFTASGTLTLQGRIHHSDTWETIGTLSSGGDNDSFDISLVDYVRFNFTVAAGSTGEIAASGFFKGATASGGGASASFTTIQTDSGTSPVATGATDTLTLTSTGGSVTIVGTAGTDTIDIEAIGLENGSGTTTLDSESAAPTSGQVLTANSATDMTWQTPTGGSTVYSNPDGTHINTEIFGASATVTGTGATAIGYNVLAEFNSVSVGSSITSTGQYNVQIGAVSAGGDRSTCVGYDSGNTAVWQTSIGAFAGATAGGSSTSVGYNANAQGLYSVAVGLNTVAGLHALSLGGATNASNYSACLGYNSSAGQRSVAIGWTMVAGTDSVSIGYASNAGNDMVALGANANADGTRSIAIGSDSDTATFKTVVIGGGTATVNGQVLIGSSTLTASDLILGNGVSSATPSATSFAATNGVGSNISGGSTTIKGSIGTGTGTGGNLIFQTAAAGTTGSALNSLVTQLELTEDGNIIMANLPTASAGLPSGALWSNSGVITIV